MKHMKKYFLISSIIFIVFNVQAQVDNLEKVRIVDSITDQPILEGRVIIKSNTDTITIIPIKNGFFFINCNELIAKNLSAIIISQNYDTLKTNIDSYLCQLENKRIIKLIRKVITMKEVIILSPLIRQDIEKITYDVAIDEESKNSSLLALMPKIPFISLSPEDNPLFKGQSNFIILLNGKRSSLFLSKNLREILKTFPASNIAKIEIITDPPPRFENEGYAGVINIVMKKNPLNGYNGTIDTNLGTFLSGINGSLNFRKNKFGLIFEGGVNYERTPFNKSYIKTLTQNSVFIQDGKNKITNLPINYSFLFSYELDSVNLFTLDMSSSMSQLKQYEENASIFNMTSPNQLSSFNSNLLNTENNEEISLNFNYQKNSKKKKDRFLTLTYSLTNDKTNSNLINTISQKQNFNSNDYTQNSKSNFLINATQLDYVHPIKKLRVEAGVKFINRKTSNNLLSEQIEPISQTLLIDTSNSDNLNYSLSLIGIYNSLYYKYKTYSFRLGVRFENTTLNGAFTKANNYIVQHYNNLLPSMKFQYKSKKSIVYAIGFKQQIQRPNINYLNPLIQRTSPGFGFSGNLNLQPVLLNNVNLELSRFKKSSVSLSLGYLFSKNSLQKFTSRINDTLVLTTFKNIGKYSRLGFDNSVEIPFSKKIDFSINGSLYYVSIKSNNGAVDLKNDGIEGFVYSYLTYKYKKMRFTANVGYYGPTISIQAKSNPYFYSSLGISKQILKEKGNVTFKMANPFQMYREVNRNFVNTNISQFNHQQRLIRGFYLSFDFNFGKLEEDVKRNSRSLLVDDNAKETGKAK